MAQQTARDEAGNIWYVDDAGNPTGLAQAASQSGVVAPNPVQAQRQSVELGGAELGNRKTAQQIALEAAKVPYAPRQAAADTTKAEAEAQAAQIALQKAQREASLPVAGQTGRANLQRAIDDIRQKFAAGPGATSGVSGLMDYLPTTANQQFDAAGNAVRGFVGPALGLTGGQLNTEKEAQRAVGPYIPQSGDRDAVILDKIQRLQGLANAMAGGKQAAQQRQQQPQTLMAGSGGGGSGNPPPPTGPAGYDVAGVAGGVGGGPGGGGNFANAAGVAMATKLKDAYNRGAGVQDLNALLVQNGFQPFADPQAIEAISKRGPLNFAPPQVDDTRGGLGRAIGNAVDNPIGAYAANATDALTGNNLDSIAGGQTGLALDYANQQNPNASLAGTLVGSTAAATGAELGLGAAAARAGLGASPWIARGADALYGAVSGAGQADGPNDSRMTGALLGGAGGLAGGIAGRAAARGIGGALTGVRNADVQGLRAAGVPLTVGQALSQSGGAFGRGAQMLENATTGLPGVGAVTRGRYTEGFEGLNRAAFNEGLAPIGANTGGVVREQGIDLARNARSQGYRDALDHVQVQEDPAFTAEFQAAHQAGARLPSDMADNARYTLDKVDEGFQSDSPIQKVNSGHGWQDYNYTSQNGDTIPFTTYPTRRGRGPIEISIDEQNLGGANRLGVGELRQAASQLRREFPEATQLHGLRISGAGAGRTQSFDFSKVAPADALPRILDGNAFQQSIRTLRRDASSVASQPYGYDFGQVTKQAEGALEGLLQRQSPGTVPAYNAANAANRNVEILKDAVNRARSGTTTGDPGLFSAAQLSDAAAANARRFGGGQGTTNQPFYNLTRAAQRVLPSKIADSGTATRAAVTAALGVGGAGGAGYATGDAEGAGYGVGGTLAIAGLLAAGGSRVGQRALTTALLDRPDALIQLGNQVQRRARIGGLFGAPMLAGAGGYFAQ